MITTGAPRWITAEQIRSALGWNEAADALNASLRDGIRAESNPPRMSLPSGNAELLVMPSEGDGWFGTKLVTVAPQNVGIPRIQGVYVLFDNVSATPIAILEATALTGIRTASVSMLAIGDRIARLSGMARVIVFGAGVQAIAHWDALSAELPPDGTSLDVTIVTRSAPSLPAEWAHTRQLFAHDREAVEDALAIADIVLCTTTAISPVFRSGAVKKNAAIVAVGSHHADKRELEGELLGRATVVVEDIPVALREAGDVILAIGEGHLNSNALVPLADVASRNATIPEDRPLVFKSVGMAWQDLALAREVFLRNAATA